MTADEFKIESPSDVAVWFKYRSSRIDGQRFVWLKDVGALMHYRKFKGVYDNVFKCLVAEGLDVKTFVDTYFKRGGHHSPTGLQAFAEDRCSTFMKNVRRNFGKTVNNVCEAMSRGSFSSSMEVLNRLCKTGMLAPNYLAGKISVYWLAGVPEICDRLKRMKPQWWNSSAQQTFKHGDDFESTFNTFLKQRDVYYHILCRAFNRTETGVDSIAVTDLRYKRVHAVTGGNTEN